MPEDGIPVIARENYLPVFIGVVISGHTAYEYMATLSWHTCTGILEPGNPIER